MHYLQLQTNNHNFIFKKSFFKIHSEHFWWEKIYQVIWISIINLINNILTSRKASVFSAAAISAIFWITASVLELFANWKEFKSILLWFGNYSDNFISMKQTHNNYDTRVTTYRLISICKVFLDFAQKSLPPLR